MRSRPTQWKLIPRSPDWRQLFLPRAACGQVSQAVSHLYFVLRQSPLWRTIRAQPGQARPVQAPFLPLLRPRPTAMRGRNARPIEQEFVLAREVDRLVLSVPRFGCATSGGLSPFRAARRAESMALLLPVPPASTHLFDRRLGACIWWERPCR
ncbi:hypothetical protein C8Q73DRAFT_464473 [Cubamyces lactineus]|nr:hypothetical protein C8Q73DRAFT_464473 [Cubamyces lactineus]